jgi:hypothetical protein
VNFKSGEPKESVGVKFIGSNGVMTTSFTQVTLDQTPRPDEFDGTISSFAKATQEELRVEWEAKHPAVSAGNLKSSSAQVFDTSEDQPQLEHHRSFYRSIREGTPSVEDATFGLRAAGPALLTNESYFQKKIMHWDAEKMEVVA